MYVCMYACMCMYNSWVASCMNLCMHSIFSLFINEFINDTSFKKTPFNLCVLCVMYVCKACAVRTLSPASRFCSSRVGEDFCAAVSPLRNASNTDSGQFPEPGGGGLIEDRRCSCAVIFDRWKVAMD